jgi:hypothetical protein
LGRWRFLDHLRNRRLFPLGLQIVKDLLLSNQIDRALARIKGMSGSEKGALSLLKIKETILNKEWNLYLSP